MGEVDSALVGLVRGGSALRLRLGEVLAEMLRVRGHEDLGFSSIDSYVRERCGVSARWAADARALSRQLEGLPRLRAALMAGEVGWSMAEVVARRATGENEAFLVALAKRTTVRRMKALLAGGGDGGESGEAQAGADGAAASEGGEVPGDRVRVRRLVARDAAALFGEVRLLVRCHAGTESKDGVLEAILAEGLGGLVAFVDEGAVPRVPKRPAPREEPEPPACEPPRVAMRFGPLADNARGLDREAVRLARELGRRALAIGDLALDLHDYGGYWALGYASESQYCRERLGVSHASIKAKKWLAKHASRLPELWAAVEEGRVGVEAARLVARVATQSSVAAWVAHAERRTFKHLRQDVTEAETTARSRGQVPAGPPVHPHVAKRGNACPVDAVTGCISCAEAGPHLGGRECSHCSAGEGLGNNSQMFGGVETVPEAADDPAAMRPAKMGRVEVVLSMSPELLQLFLLVEVAWKRAGRPLGDLFRYLSAEFVATWEHDLDPDVAYAESYWRDGWQCASPTCERRDVTPHHLVFRSQGGGDEPENVIALCSWCHLEGIHHVGSIKAEGPAPDMRWKTPVLEVHGREVVWRG